MTRSDLVDALAAQFHQLPSRDAEMVVKTILDSMADALAHGHRIEIRGFGSFKIKEYEGYAGRNPKTGESVVVASKRLPFFRAGKELKEFINQ